jgi:phospholipid/cholesterol/gamma-HCH transport system substrate-binding protein
VKGNREQVWVGIFVLIAVGVLVSVVLAVSGTFSKKGIAHKAYFRYAAGLAPGAPVRYGGLQAGRIVALRVDPQDSTRIEVDFDVDPGIPVKTDSLAKITALGALGENYLEITTGAKDSPLMAPGSVLKSKEMVAIADLGDMISGLVPTADQALQNLNGRLAEMKQTVAQVNDLLNDQNRKNIGSGLGTLNAMLAENRPKVAATLDNVQTASDKLSPVLANAQTASDKVAPLLDDLKGTVKQANDTLAHADAMLAENRPDIRAAMVDVRKMLTAATAMVEQLQDTADRNTDNLDETLANVRAATDNMQQLTDALKRHPSVIIRGETGKDRRPGDKQ